ncbi:hypothetical protein FB451DRAFT_1181790 [Mycena latifolia]|nr:hypothetical protein FB451DRAFT_1181790 [Mycena latifolia]
MACAGSRGTGLTWTLCLPGVRTNFESCGKARVASMQVSLEPWRILSLSLEKMELVVVWGSFVGQVRVAGSGAQSGVRDETVVVDTSGVVEREADRVENITAVTLFWEREVTVGNFTSHTCEGLGSLRSTQSNSSHVWQLQMSLHEPFVPLVLLVDPGSPWPAAPE